MANVRGWLEDLGERAGPLRAAALGFCAAQRLDSAARGVPAIKALGRALDRFCHEPEGSDPHEEDRFIEGAGAYLGLIALDAHGGAGHRLADGRHRVCLGAQGWFDPFAVIDAALDADQPLLALADGLTLAEAEAHDEGPISRVLQALAETLARDYPEARVTQVFELDVVLDDGTQIDLRRLTNGLGWPHSADDQRRLRRDTERLVAMLPRRAAAGQRRTPSPADVAECLARLLPRPVAPTFARDLPDGVELCTVPLHAEVWLAYVEQHAGRARFLRADELPDLGGEVVVRAAALHNLRQRSTRMRFELLAAGGHTWLAGKTGDGLDAARVILPEAHAHARSLLPGAGIAVVPHRDTILFAPQRDTEALEQYARELLARAPHPISARALPLL